MYNFTEVKYSDNNNKNTAAIEIHMMYIPGYGWYVILGLFLKPKQRDVFEVQSYNWYKKWEKVLLREKSDVGLWIQTCSNLGNMAITSTCFTTSQHTQFQFSFQFSYQFFSWSMYIK